MEFVSPMRGLDIGKLRRKMDIRNLTVQVANNSPGKGRFYLLWRNGNFIVIQAEPWSRPDCKTDAKSRPANYLEEQRALWYMQDVIQTMLDTIVFDSENNWAYLVHIPKLNTYRLVYTKRRFFHEHMLWTKVVELDDIEITRIVSGLCWEGIYEGKDVDLYIGWQGGWGQYLATESRGQKLIESRNLGRYFFELKAHVAKNGVIIGIMMEALIGRCVTLADRFDVFDAVAEIQQQGITFIFQICDIYITERGVRFASASSAKYYQDRDELAKEAEFAWNTLDKIFNHMDEDPLKGRLCGSRLLGSSAFIMPRLPSPDRPIALTREEAIIRLVWSTIRSNEFVRLQLGAFRKFYALCCSHENAVTRRGKRIEGDTRALLPPEDSSNSSATSDTRPDTTDKPLVVKRRARQHPYARPASARLLLPREE